MNAKSLMLLSAVLAMSVAWAEDGGEDETDQLVAEAEAQQKKAQEPRRAVFRTLPECRLVRGIVEYLKVGGGAWQAVDQGRYYPLGSGFRVRNGGRLELWFGPDSSVVIEGDASFFTKAQPLGEKSRTVVLDKGKVTVRLANDFVPGGFFVAAPGFLVKDMQGTMSFLAANKGDGDEVIIDCVSGAMTVEGRHFKIPAMPTGTQIRIRTSADSLQTLLYGLSGNCLTELDQGLKYRREVDEDGKVKELVETSTLKWHLSPQTKVRIARMVPEIGERLSVSMLTFDAAGNLKNNFAFAEGRPQVNSGEIVPPEAKDKEELAKRAAEATGEGAPGGEASTDETSDKEDKENNNSEEEEE